MLSGIVKEAPCRGMGISMLCRISEALSVGRYLLRNELLRCEGEARLVKKEECLFPASISLIAASLTADLSYTIHYRQYLVWLRTR
jgi:hypothetical protein